MKRKRRGGNQMGQTSLFRSMAAPGSDLIFSMAAPGSDLLIFSMAAPGSDLIFGFQSKLPFDLLALLS